MKPHKSHPLPSKQDVDQGDKSFSIIDSRLNMLETNTLDLLGILSRTRSQQFSTLTRSEIDALQSNVPRKRVVL